MALLGYSVVRFSQEPLLVARLVAYLPLRNSMLSVTPGGRSALVCRAPPISPAPILKGSARSPTLCFSGLWGRVKAYTFHLVTRAYLPAQLSPSGHYTSKRLTRPYLGELPADAALSQLATLPGFPGLTGIHRIDRMSKFALQN